MTSGSNQVWMFGINALCYSCFLFFLVCFIVLCLKQGVCRWTDHLSMTWGFVIITEMAVNSWSDCCLSEMEHAINRMEIGPSDCSHRWGLEAKLWRLLIKKYVMRKNVLMLNWSQKTSQSKTPKIHHSKLWRAALKSLTCTWQLGPCLVMT